MERGVVGDTSSAGKQREQRGMVVNTFRGRQGREGKKGNSFGRFFSVWSDEIHSW